MKFLGQFVKVKESFSENGIALFLGYTNEHKNRMKFLCKTKNGIEKQETWETPEFLRVADKTSPSKMKIYYGPFTRRNVFNNIILKGPTAEQFEEEFNKLKKLIK